MPKGCLRARIPHLRTAHARDPRLRAACGPTIHTTRPLLGQRSMPKGCHRARDPHRKGHHWANDPGRWGRLQASDPYRRAHIWAAIDADGPRVGPRFMRDGAHPGPRSMLKGRPLTVIHAEGPPLEPGIQAERVALLQSGDPHRRTVFGSTIHAKQPPRRPRSMRKGVCLGPRPAAKDRLRPHDQCFGAPLWSTHR